MWRDRTTLCLHKGEQAGLASRGLMRRMTKTKKIVLSVAAVLVLAVESLREPFCTTAAR